MPGKKKQGPMPPFIPVLLRGYIEAEDPFEIAVIVALQFWHWWKGDKGAKAELGSKGVAILAKMSDGKARQILDKLKAKGWVESSRRFGGKMRYSLAIPEMTWDEGKAEASKLLPQLILDNPQLAMWEQLSCPVVTDELSPRSRLIPNTDSLKTHKNTPVGGNAPNPWGDLMKIFSEHGVTVLKREPRHIGLVNVIGGKLGQKVFQAVALEYCINEYTKRGGRSVNGFINQVERLADIAHQKGQSTEKKLDERRQDKTDKFKRRRTPDPIVEKKKGEAVPLGNLLDAFKARLKQDQGNLNG